uniref:Putative ATPase domain containing protein n=1 Tax=viral metagenome TaxID=1070528 RepID=A0A6M3LP30_9ZZZZ
MKKYKMYYNADIKSALEKSIEINLPALLVGDTGTGKTSFIYDLAQQKGKKNVIRINLTGQTGVDEIIGKWLANKNGTYWIDGLLITAMKKGYWIVLDEINMALPEILSKLHSLLDDDRKIVLNEKKGEIISCHKDFRFFATMNPDEEYAGTKELNKAFISRFPIIAHIDYSPKEAEIIQERTGIDFDTCAQLVNIAREIRKNKEEEKLSYICSTRDLIYCGSLIKAGIKKGEAIKFSILNKAPKDERVPIQKLISLISGTEIIINDNLKYDSISEMIKDFKEKEEEIKTIVEQSDKVKKEYEDLSRRYREQTDTFIKSEKNYRIEIEKLKQDKKVTIVSVKIDGKKIKLENGDKVQIAKKTLGDDLYLDVFQENLLYGKYGYIEEIKGDPYNKPNDKQNCIVVRKFKYPSSGNQAALFALSDINLIEKNK